MLIAKIELMPQTNSWYDELTNIYLTQSKPQADVTDKVNLSNIKRGIKHELIRTYQGEINMSPEPEGPCDFDPNLYYTKAQTQNLINNVAYDFGAYT